MTQEIALDRQKPLLVDTVANNFISHEFDEYQASLGDLKVHVGIVRSQEQLNQIYALRQDTYQDKMSYLLNSDSSADLLDASSYIFYCRSGKQILASCRYTKQVNGEWESPEITDLSFLVPVDQSQLLQIGRFLVASEYRGQMLSEILVWACNHWLFHNTPYICCFGICAPALVRFYRHFNGKSVANARITLPERHNRTYRLIYGVFDSTAQTLESYMVARGWSLNYPDGNKLTEIPSQGAEFSFAA